MTDQTNDFTGNYVGVIQGTPTTLRLDLDSQGLSGNANAGGYLYELAGTAQGDRATGQIRDPQTGAIMGFEVVLHGDVLTLSMAFPDLFTGQFNNVTMQFQRQTTVAAGETTNAAGEQDAAVVGEWIRSESMSGSGISLVIQEMLRISSDGTFLKWDPKIAGPMGTMSGPDSISGKWRTEQRIIYTMLPGQPQWLRYGRYTVQGNSLMFTLVDGSKGIVRLKRVDLQSAHRSEFRPSVHATRTRQSSGSA